MKKLPNRIWREEVPKDLEINVVMKTYNALEEFLTVQEGWSIYDGGRFSIPPTTTVEKLAALRNELDRCMDEVEQHYLASPNNSTVE